MQKRWVLLSTAVMVTGMLLLSITAAIADDQQVIKVGKKGEVRLSEDTQVGDLTLKAGDYQMQHRVEGSNHMVHFTELKGMHNPSAPSGPTSVAHPGEVKCRLEPMSAKAKQTSVTMSTEGGVHRITRIEIAGENVAHVF